MKQKSQTGSILIALLFIMPALFLISASYTSLTVNSYRIAQKDKHHTQSQFAADAGVDYAVQQINQDNDWTGTGGESVLMSNTEQRITYETTVTPNGTGRTIVSTGRTYRPATAITPQTSVKIEVDLRAVSSGSYSIVTGVGGLVMENSARVLGGDVFINGTITMSNTSQIGLSTSPTDVTVAHQSCPAGNNPGATYPRLCASGENGQPISIGNSARIYGNVRANNQTNGARMSDPGLTAGSGVVPAPLPVHDRDAQEAAVAHNRTGADASCSGSQSKTWAANTKITGNVTLTQSCQITVEGDVWITGNLTISNTSRLNVANALGTTQPDIMVDGSNGVDIGNSGLLNPNILDTGFQIITYWSAASCSPDCANVTGNDLYNSRNNATIELSQSASGANSIFYSRWSRVEVANTGAIGALVGQTIYLRNSGAITFGTSVGTGTTYFVVDGYRRTFN